MRLSRIAETWEQVGATRSRAAKTTLIADALVELADQSPAMLAAGTSMLTGAPRQGRLGVGWAGLRDLEVPPRSVRPSARSARAGATDHSHHNDHNDHSDDSDDSDDSGGTPESDLDHDVHVANDGHDAAAVFHDPLSVADVDTAFAALAAASGPGSQTVRHTALSDLWARATQTEQAFLTGVILQNLRQGALEGVVMAAVARAADVDEALVRRATMLTGDPTATAVMAMQAGTAGLEAVRLQVGRGVQPMLASSAPDVAAALEVTGMARIDTKLDGMRIQVHIDGDHVSVFTRSLRDVTSSLSEVVRIARSLPVRTAVLDGEALALDNDGRPRAFQDSMSVDAPLRPVFFDLLHLDGTDLLDEPLATRRRALVEIAGHHLVDGIETDDPEVGLDHLRSALAAGHEGIVVKALDAPWEAGRRGASWVKVKVAHTLDLVVLAAEWGSGRRRGWLSNLHLGAIDAESGEPVMLGKTFKGMTDEMLTWQTGALLAREVDRADHVVHVRPELVVEIAFDGVQVSARYPGGVTLRFARVKRYREDKTMADADTLQTVRAIHQGEVTAQI